MTNTGEHGDIDRRASKLATERAALFDKSGANFGLSATDQARLQAVERELDECFLARRRQRALTDARRFDRDGPVIRRAIPRRPTQ